MALTAENERLNIDCKEWQQKLKESEERSSAGMRELQDKCKSLEKIIENLKREMEEALDKCKSLENKNENLERELWEIQETLEEGWEEEEAGLEKKASATSALSTIGTQIGTYGTQVWGYLSTSSGGSKKRESVKDNVKSTMKDKTLLKVSLHGSRPS